MMIRADPSLETPKMTMNNNNKTRKMDETRERQNAKIAIAGGAVPTPAVLPANTESNSSRLRKLTAT